MIEAASPWSDAALIIAAHGAGRCPLQEEPATLHADALRRRSLFAQVEAGFWKREPNLVSMVRRCPQARVFIVPLFISGGYFADRVIPSALGFDSSPQEHWGRMQSIDGRGFYYCREVGSHPAMADVILARVREVLNRDLSAADATATALVIAGHGTAKHASSKKAILDQAERIRQRGLFARVEAAFLEESPRIDEIHGCIDVPDMVVAPFFIGEGGHVGEDIPILLGADAQDVRNRLQARLPAWQNPSQLHGKRIWYAGPVGNEPLLAEVVLERVRGCAASREEAQTP